MENHEKGAPKRWFIPREAVLIIAMVAILVLLKFAIDWFKK